MSSLKLELSSNTINTIIDLPSSKSESNRALILQHLSKGNFSVTNLASADDTQTLLHILENLSELKEIDCGPAGTTFRFLTALLAFTDQDYVLTGSQRMKERPIKDLVDALKQLGADISYLENEGYPPLKIKGRQASSNTTSISVENSSQYLTALLLIGAFLPKGIHIKTIGNLGSAPYVNMTIKLLNKAGISVEQHEGNYTIQPQKSVTTIYQVEGDWSGASYWFSRIALAEVGSIIHIKGLRKDSLQGDRVVCDIYHQLGVDYTFTKDGLTLTKSERKPTNKLTWDFIDCPDLAQTVMASCTVMNVEGEFTGLKSLRIKETDRIAAMQTELAKIGGQLTSEDDTIFNLTPSQSIPSSDVSIATYHDHRMAMTFAPLAAKVPRLIIEDAGVVSKSYPTFWKDLALTGVKS